MKLDKIKFARLIGYLAQKVPLHSSEIEDIDNLIDIEAEVTVVRPCNDDIDRLMMLMVEGTRKIEAIKIHRTLTGYGLKESKDAVERYWKEPAKPTNTKEMLDKLDQQLEAASDIGYTLKGFSDNQLINIKDFIESFRD